MRRLGGAVWLGGALACGAFLAWMDSSPGWDDTGITVGLALVGSALFGALRPSWAWASALAVGAWLPVIEIPATGNFGALAALAFAFAGAYGGAFARRLLSRGHPPLRADRRAALPRWHAACLLAVRRWPVPRCVRASVRLCVCASFREAMCPNARR